MRGRLLTSVATITAVASLLIACSKPPSAIEEEYAALDASVLADNANEVAQCVLEETGFEVTAGSDGSVGYTASQVPIDQEDLVNAAIPACFEELGFMSDGQLSSSQLTRLYELELVAQQCLEREGYDTGEPPSAQVFADTWGTPNLWAPWGVMGQYQLSDEELATLLKKCPDPASFPPN